MSELTDEGERGQRPEAQKAKSECAAAQMYSDCRSNVPCQGKTRSYQIIKLSTIYTPIMPQKFGMEFAKVALKVFVQQRGRFPRTRILINSHARIFFLRIYLPYPSFVFECQVLKWIMASWSGVYYHLRAHWHGGFECFTFPYGLPGSTDQRCFGKKTKCKTRVRDPEASFRFILLMNWNATK